MEGAKEFIKKKGIVPSLSFTDKKIHILKLAKSKIDTIQTDGGPKEGVSVLVEENGQTKRFFTASESLISKLAELPEGSVVSIEMKSRKTDDGRFINYYDVQKVKTEFSQGQNESSDEIPIIEDDPKGEISIGEEEPPAEEW